MVWGLAFGVLVGVCGGMEVHSWANGVALGSGIGVFENLTAYNIGVSHESLPRHGRNRPLVIRRWKIAESLLNTNTTRKDLTSLL